MSTSALAMPDETATREAVIGCLLDVSGSMRTALEVNQSDGDANDRLRAVLSAALKFAQTEKNRHPNSRMFVGAFGLNADAGYPPVIDLCGVVKALFDGCDNDKGGRDLLFGIANENSLAHITEYIVKKLRDNEAHIVYAHVRGNQKRINEFATSIPAAPVGWVYKATKSTAQSVIHGTVELIAGSDTGRFVAGKVGDAVKDEAVDSSQAMEMKRRICREWLSDFTEFVAHPVSDVVNLLERLQDNSTTGVGGDAQRSGNTLQDNTPRVHVWHDTDGQRPDSITAGV